MLLKILKIIGLLIVLYLISAFFAKSSYKVERSSSINAPQKLVYNQVGILRNWENWSPWMEKDPTVKNTYEGVHGMKGSIMKWVGDKDLSGTGQIEIISVDDPNAMHYQLTFKVPFDMKSNGSFVVTSERPDKCKVTWTDSGTIPFVMRPMMMFMDMDKEIGPDFERGLIKIDSVCSFMYKQLLQTMAQDTVLQTKIVD